MSGSLVRIGIIVAAAIFVLATVEGAAEHMIPGVAGR